VSHLTLSSRVAEDRDFLLRAHKEVLWFASPFFEAALSGNWAETGRPLSISSVITISQPPIVPGDKIHPDAPTAMKFAPMDPDIDPEELDVELSESSEPEVIESSTSTIVGSREDDKQTHGPAAESQSHGTRVDAVAEKKAHEAARMESLEKLQRGASGNASTGSTESPTGPDKGRGKGIVKLSWKRGNTQVSTRHHQTTGNPDAVIVLKEEKVWPFLRCAYTDPLPSHRHLRRAPFMTFCDSSILGTPFSRRGGTHRADLFPAAWSARSHGTTWRVS
jgi:hypothetical protein